ncbi:tRNA-dependent cyclodipeptide synthase [Nocardia colli]|uniref:Cyclodipeptide synthase n=1 Tax=Nocardia colli TaxID=2545717 RepID=A0A5N0E8B7_9NOCA|nr:tRNA-dependent cyclodipeptide synthase [Nocardia colli]KAA8885658.1 tRNA-dependent cyclodipeptide synthase [Nocardia colli]
MTATDLARVVLSTPTARTRTVFDAGEAVMLGASPFNSFYRPATVETLVDWAAPRFEHVYVLLPGAEAAQRFIVAGMAPRQAVRKTIVAVHQRRRAARAALLRAGCADPDRYVLVWSRLAGNARYRTLREQVEHAYGTVPLVRDLIRSMVTTVLSHTAGAPLSPAAIDRNVAYVFAEAPLLVDAPGVLGHQHVLFAYHRPVPLHDLFTTGLVPGLRPVPGQAVAQLSIEGAGA